MVRLVTVLVLCCAWPLGARAQEGIRSEPSLALLPAPGLERVAAGVARTLERRTGTTVMVGGAPPDPPEAVLPGQVALVPVEGELHLVLGGPEGVSFSTRVPRPRTRDDAGLRAVALAIETLRDSAREPRPASGEEPDVPSAPSHHPPRTRTRTRRSVEPIAKPTIFFRLLLGVSPARGRLLVGPGMGLGLCVTRHCMVIEGDLPLIPEEQRASDGLLVRYLPISFSMRFQFRPFQFGDFVPGVTLGLLTRIGRASLVGTDVSRVQSNLGARGTVEIAWRFAGRFELVLESGMDLAINRARFRRDGGEILLLEDRWTPWAVTSIRLRP